MQGKTEIREIDGKKFLFDGENKYLLTEILPEEQHPVTELIRTLEEAREEYATLADDILEKEQEIAKEDAFIAEQEFLANREVYFAKDGDKPKYKNETERETAKKDLLKKDEIHAAASNARHYKQGELKVLKARLDVLTFQTGINKRILEYFSGARNGEKV